MLTRQHASGGVNPNSSTSHAIKFYVAVFTATSSGRLFERQPERPVFNTQKRQLFLFDEFEMEPHDSASLCRGAGVFRVPLTGV